jgi:hypothetical protein
MNESPIVFPWPVHKHGYDIVEGALVPRAPGGIGTDALSDPRDSPLRVDADGVLVPSDGPLKYYYPLDDESLWLQFADTCVDAEGVLKFATKFGRLSGSSESTDNRVEDILAIAAKFQHIMQLLKKGERRQAILLFHKDGHAPRMKEIIAWFSNNNMRFTLLPQTLQDALFHQVGEAITGNRPFRRCRNEGCPNWFRLGPHAGSGGRGSTTVTTRREFCSDRCRVASARRKKREIERHA